MEENILVCEDSLEGIFTAVYEAYAGHFAPSHTFFQIGPQEDIRLFSRYYGIKTDRGKAEKVAGTLRRRMGAESYDKLCQAGAAEDAEKGTAIYRTVAKALTLSEPGLVMEQHADAYVRKVYELARRVYYESHHLLGFLRFQELEGGRLFSRIGPKSNVLAFLAEHFSERLGGENFIIHDTNRGLFALHEAEKPWFIVENADFQGQEFLKYSKEEELYAELFCHFCHKIAIRERENKNLQRNVLPLRFREFMVEFERDVKKM